MESFLKDLKFGIRMLLKNPGFTLVAVLSLSVGIGVNSTVFSFVNTIFFKAINVTNSDGLVYVFAGDRGNPYRTTSYYRFTEFRQQNDVFSGLAAYSAPPMLMTRGDHTEEISSEVVSGDYFSVLGITLQRGQGLTTEHDQLSATAPSVVISDRFWKNRLSSDPDIVGKQLVLNGNSFSVVGITSPLFTGTDPTVSTDVWVPITQWATLVQNMSTAARDTEPANSADAQQPQTSNTSRTNRLTSPEQWLNMVGRLKPGVAVEQAESVMSIIATRLPRTEGEDQPLQVSLSPVTSIHPEVQEAIPAALFIIALTSLILMICCVNVASLMLSRAAARQKEFAIRVALGSSRNRFVRQLLTEALLLSLVGGILGLLFAVWTTRVVLGLIPSGDFGFSAGVPMDRRVLGFSVVISLLTALIFGLLPALSSFRPNLVQSLGAEAMALGGSRRKVNLRRVMVVLQIVASMVLLISAGLFLRSFQQGGAISESFMSDKILLLDLSPRKYGYTVQYSKTFFRQLLGRVSAMPGVQSATLSNLVPLTTHTSTTLAGIEGRDAQPLKHSVVAEGYFKTLNIPFLRGREFDTTDDNSSRKTVVINETMAKTFWPNENPLGKQIKMGEPYDIIGVAKDSSYNSFGKSSEPYVYLWLYQHKEYRNLSLIVRTSGQPTTMIPVIQRDIKELGGNLPMFDFKTLADLTQSQLGLVKAATLLLTLLSLIGLVVASIGIYGVTSYAFSQRRREIGIRMALGAQRQDILKLIMKEGITLALLGIVIGVTLALGTTHFVSSFLYGVSPVDPLVFFGVSALLGLVALGASLVPAIMAAKANPVDALRYQ
jgi:predicted permease